MKLKFTLLSCLLFLLPSFLFADGSSIDFEVDGIAYHILSEEERTVETTSEQRIENLSSYTYPKQSGAVIIPSTVQYDGKSYTVVAIGEDTFDYTGVTSVQIPKTVKSIGSYAFWGTHSLKEIEIPGNVETLGTCAFEGSGVEKVVLHE